MKANKEKLLSQYFEELKGMQEKLLPAALDMASADSLNLSASNANATLQMLSGFSPLFLQFLAWQRLMQLQDEIGLMDNPMAPWVDMVPKKRKRKRSKTLNVEDPPVKIQKSNATNETNGQEKQTEKISVAEDKPQPAKPPVGVRRMRGGRRKPSQVTGISIKASTGKPVSSTAIVSGYNTPIAPTPPRVKSGSKTSAPVPKVSHSKGASVKKKKPTPVPVPVDDETESITEVVKPKGQTIQRIPWKKSHSLFRTLQKFKFLCLLSS